jgi:hypothetical protein
VSDDVREELNSLRRRVEALEAPRGVRLTIDFDDTRVSVRMQTPGLPQPREVAAASDITKEGLYLHTGQGPQFLIVAADADAARAVLDRYYPKP